MPPAALAALAKRAGVRIRTAERYWKQAKASATKYGKKARDRWAYIMGIVKRRLGLANEDLLLAGLPVCVLLESIPLKALEEQQTGSDPWLALALTELWFVDKYGMDSSLFERGSDAEEITIKEGFTAKIETCITIEDCHEYLQEAFPRAAWLFVQGLTKEGEDVPTKGPEADKPGEGAKN